MCAPTLGHKESVSLTSMPRNTPTMYTETDDASAKGQPCTQTQLGQWTSVNSSAVSRLARQKPSDAHNRPRMKPRKRISSQTGEKATEASARGRLACKKADRSRQRTVA